MDRFIYKLSTTIARSSTRRSFLSRCLRGAVGAGLGASVLFGRPRYAFADKNCTWFSSQKGNSNCNGTIRCGGADAKDPKNPVTGSDGNGCGPIDPRTGKARYCTADQCDNTDPMGIPACKDPLMNGGYWVCCCKGMLSFCRDCVKQLPGDKFPTLVCICQNTKGKCGG